MAKPVLAGNWKMHGSVENASDLAGYIVSCENRFFGAEIVIFPPLLHVDLVARAVKGSGVSVGAQNMSQHSSGAYTGEISGEMLSDIGCSYVLVGHSERRHLFSETLDTTADKFKSAQSNGLMPILCVGESALQRQKGQTIEVVTEQINGVIDLVGLDSLCKGIIAYEPVWAIGTGQVASPEQAQLVHAEIRRQLGFKGMETRILYGGSVNLKNAANLFAQPDIAGALVGGASINGQEFVEIAHLLN